MKKLYNPWPEHEGNLFRLSDVRLIRQLLKEGLSLKEISILIERTMSDIDLMLWRVICEPIN